jgi:membrane-bound lytic murein transglycosylase D
MENENPKPQTGGLKLMTVFIGVLALHVVVIGGVTAYHFFKGHKNAEVAADKNGTGTDNKDGALPADPALADAGKPPEIPAVNTSETVGGPTTDVTIRPPLHDATAPGVENSPLPLAPANPLPATPVAAGKTGAPSIPSKAAASAVAGTTTTMPGNPSMAPAVSGTPAPVATTDAKPTPAIADYMVKKGDSLYRIARAANTTVPHLKELNGMTADHLKVGQTIKVPEGTLMAHVETPTNTPAPKSTKSGKGAKKIVAVASHSKASAHGTSHTVVKGDSLYRIAKHYGTTPAAIMAANGIKNPSKLTVGKTIVIPSNGEKRIVTERQESAPAVPQAPAPKAEIALNQ